MAVFQRAPSQGQGGKLSAVVLSLVLLPALLFLLSRFDVLPSVRIEVSQSAVVHADSLTTFKGPPDGVSGGTQASSSSLAAASSSARPPGAANSSSSRAAPSKGRPATRSRKSKLPGSSKKTRKPGCSKKFNPVHEVGHLEQSLWEKVQADPGLVGRDPSLLKHFEPAPWLLPARTKALPYAGVHDLDELIKLRSQPQGGYNKTVALLLFNKSFTVFAQNCIYTMVKFGEVTNYVVGTWFPEDMEACMDLNLPCADVSRFMPMPLRKNETASFGQYNYYVLTWLKPQIAYHILQQGYALLMSDTDIAYTTKPVWASYFNLLAVSQADTAFQWEYAVNTGNYVVLPTPGGLDMLKRWSRMAKKSIANNQHDQDGMADLPDRVICGNQHECKQVRSSIEQGHNRAALPIIRHFWPPQFQDDPDVCAFIAVDRAPMLDVCHWSVMIIHPVCSSDRSVKRGVLAKLGFWHVDDEKDGLPWDGCPVDNSTASQVQRCRPLRWRQPHHEDKFLSCSKHRLALTSLLAEPSPPPPPSPETKPPQQPEPAPS